jgi:hypothetical protein
MPFADRGLRHVTTIDRSATRHYDAVRRDVRISAKRALPGKRRQDPAGRHQEVGGMSSQKLVRCLIRRRGSKEKGSPRFIPLEIFGLWEYLMSTKHDFEVVEPRASLWLDMEDSPEAAYSENQYDRVTEVTAFVYSGRDDMFTKACRYFRSDECEDLKGIFLKHYSTNTGRPQAHVRERQGIWLHRENAATVETVA